MIVVFDKNGKFIKCGIDMDNIRQEYNNDYIIEEIDSISPPSDIKRSFRVIDGKVVQNVSISIQMDKNPIVADGSDFCTLTVWADDLIPEHDGSEVGLRIDEAEFYISVHKHPDYRNIMIGSIELSVTIPGRHQIRPINESFICADYFLEAI